jgi:hypothetical protein
MFGYSGRQVKISKASPGTILREVSDDVVSNVEGDSTNLQHLEGLARLE